MRTIIFKALEKCNANCIYCYVKPNSKVMGFDLLETTFSKINIFLERNTSESIELLWHGGEVCLLGSKYFRKALAIQQKTCKNTFERINHSIQSNLTLINQDLIDTFKLLGIKSIGTSYDMVPNIRGIGSSIDSEKYNSSFFRGIDLLRDNNIQFGIIYVVHKKTLQYDPIEVFDHLTNIAYDGSVKFNPIILYGNDRYGLNISEEEYAHFKGKIFAEWWKLRYTYPQIGNFRDYYNQVINNPYGGVCVNTGRCAYRWLMISPNGNVNHCCENTDSVKMYGNIKDKSLEELYFHKNRNQIASRHFNLTKTQCSDCVLWGLCHGGCAWAARNTTNTFNSAFGCKSKKIFFFEYFIPITGLSINLKPQVI